MFGHFQQNCCGPLYSVSVERDGFFQQLDLTEFISESAVTLGADLDWLFFKTLRDTQGADPTRINRRPKPVDPRTQNWLLHLQ